MNFLETEDVVKQYANHLALDKVSIQVPEGKVFGLLGPNGAGKTTLIRIINRITAPDSGLVRFNGREFQPEDIYQIGYLPEERGLYKKMKVGEQAIYLAQLKGLSYQEARIRLIRWFEKFDIMPWWNKKLEELSKGMQQKIQFIITIIHEPKLLIFDEPFSGFDPVNAERLKQEILELKEKGHTIIFISHKLDEIKKICDRATIMRNGRSMGTYDVKDISTQEMSRLMVGREVSLKFDKKEQHLTDDVFMRVRNLTVHNAQGVLKVDNLSFDLKGGEILGIAGVEGNGQSELIDTLTGLNKNYSGEVKIKGEDITKDSIEDIRELKLAHIPEDRMTSGCAGNLSIMENIFSNQYKDKKFSGRFLLKRKAMEQRSDELIKEYMVKCKSRKQNVGMLSGGNIQKVIVAREFSTGPDIIIANQPTRGIDVGAAAFIRKRLLEFRDAGCAVILISADLTEIFSLSDRLAVMYKGKFAGFFTDVENVTEDELGQHMLGIKHDDVLEGVLYE